MSMAALCIAFRMLRSLKYQVALKKMNEGVADFQRGSEEMVTVLRANGEVLELEVEMSVADLLRRYPGHAVCHARTLWRDGACKMLCPNTHLLRGEVYLLIAVPDSQPATSPANPLRCTRASPLDHRARSTPDVRTGWSPIASDQPGTAGGVNRPTSTAVKVMLPRQILGTLAGENSTHSSGVSMKAEAECDAPYQSDRKRLENLNDLWIGGRVAPMPSQFNRKLSQNPPRNEATVLKSTSTSSPARLRSTSGMFPRPRALAEQREPLLGVRSS